MAICDECGHEYLDSYERCPFCERRENAPVEPVVPVGRDRRAGLPPLAIALIGAVGAGVAILVYLAITMSFAGQAKPVEDAVARQACFANQALTESAAGRYAAEHSGDSPDTLGELTGDYLESTPACPGGGTYTWDSRRSRLTCSIHGWHGDR